MRSLVSIIISMGYEENIPPIPTRQEEGPEGALAERTLLRRPLRAPAVPLQEALCVPKRAPLLHGVPATLLSYKYNSLYFGAQKARRLKFGTTAIPVYLLSIYVFAKMSTDMSPIQDYTMEQAKDHRWL